MYIMMTIHFLYGFTCTCMQCVCAIMTHFYMYVHVFCHFYVIIILNFVPFISPEVEVAMVNSGLLSPRSNDGTPPPNGNPDLFAAFPHSPLSPLSMQPLPLSPSVPSMGGSPSLYPCLELEGLDYADTLDYAVLTTPPGGHQVTLTRTNSDINMTRVSS